MFFLRNLRGFDISLLFLDPRVVLGSIRVSFASLSGGFHGTTSSFDVKLGTPEERPEAKIAPLTYFGSNSWITTNPKPPSLFKYSHFEIFSFFRSSRTDFHQFFSFVFPLSDEALYI